MSKGLDYTALTLVIVGAVNWGLIGIFKLDLVNLIFGNMTWMSRVIYTLIGISGLYLLSLYGRVMDCSESGICLNNQGMDSCPVKRRQARCRVAGAC